MTRTITIPSSRPLVFLAAVCTIALAIMAAPMLSSNRLEASRCFANKWGALPATVW